MYVQLPFMEDLRQYMFSSLKNSKKCTPTGEFISICSLIASKHRLFLGNHLSAVMVGTRGFHRVELLGFQSRSYAVTMKVGHDESRGRFALDSPNTVWFPISDLEFVSREQLVGNGCTFSGCEPVRPLLK